MRRPSPLAIFAVSTLAWILALTAIWTLASKWTSYPAAVLSQMALEAGAPDWVRKVRLAPGAMEVDTRIEVFVPNSGGKRAELVVDAVPSRYAYGLPILLALLFAARGPKRLGRALAGYALLLPAQAFSLTFYLLMQMVLGAQGDRVSLKVASWQLDAIAYGYQLGVLVVPALVPVLLWLWLDKSFVADILRRQTLHKGETAPSA
jgi:hypothetical protein